MSITVIPVNNGMIGPGMYITVESSVVGPPQPGSLWVIEIMDSGEDIVMQHQQKVFSSGGETFPVGMMSDDGAFGIGEGGVTDGGTVSISVHIQQPTAGVFDTGTVGGVTWNPNQNAVFANMINTRWQIQHGVFGSDEAAALEEIRTATFAPFGPDIRVPIESLISAPPLGFLRRELITPDRTGESTLTRTVGPVAVDAFGLAWEFVSVAPGIGTNEGAPDELFTKALELQLVHTLGDSTLIESAHAQFNFGDAFWIFTPMLPTYVRYWIGPGVTVRFFWLII